MGMTKKGWEKRRRNGNDIPWNKGLKGAQVAWNKGKTKADTPILAKMGFQKGHKFFGDIKVISECSRKRTGEKHPNWKGGLTPEMMKIRNCLLYRQWRSDVFTRDDFTCQNCFKRGGKLEAHHIKEFSVIIEENKITTYEEAVNCEELWNLNNGKTLCKECHRNTKHNVNNSRKDYRKYVKYTV